MRIAFFSFNKRPQVDSQNTGRDVYVSPFSPFNVSANGLGGMGNLRSLSPVSPTSFNRPFVTPADLTGIGNEFNTNPMLDPLNDKSTRVPQF